MPKKDDPDLFFCQSSQARPARERREEKRKDAKIRETRRAALRCA